MLLLDGRPVGIREALGALLGGAPMRLGLFYLRGESRVEHWNIASKGEDRPSKEWN